ncbi:hypothetical protein JCM21900_002388 [Sporobolomyces salmonicolor]
MSSPQSPSSLPPSPPSRPVPIPPSLAPLDDASLESTIDSSTLRFLSSSLSSTFLPWLFRLVVFTACAKLVRFASPALFRATRGVAGTLFGAFEWTVKGAAWAGMWGGLAVVAIWGTGGLAMAVAYGAIRAKPGWRGVRREWPVASAVGARAAAYGLVWALVRRFVARRVAQVVVLLLLGQEVWSFLRARPRGHGRASGPTSAAVQARASAAEQEQEAAEEETERWARKVREEMLRDSLLRRGRAGGAKAEEEEREREPPELE